MGEWVRRSHHDYCSEATISLHQLSTEHGRNLVNRHKLLPTPRCPVSLCFCLYLCFCRLFPSSLSTLALSHLLLSLFLTDPIFSPLYSYQLLFLFFSSLSLCSPSRVRLCHSFPYRFPPPASPAFHLNPLRPPSASLFIQSTVFWFLFLPQSPSDCQPLACLFVFGVLVLTVGHFGK